MTSGTRATGQAGDRIDEAVGYALKRAQHALRAAMDEGLRPHGLTTAQYAALVALDEATGAPSNAELARRCFVTPQTMNEIAGGLVGAGFVERRPAADDRRVVRLALTAAGAAALAPARITVAAVERRMLAPLDAPRRAALLDALRACVAGLEVEAVDGERSAS